jgi:hypothetical protein
MRPRHAGIAIVWLGALAGAIASLALLVGDERFRGLSLTLAGCILLTFVVQLSFPEKVGFVSRLMASIVGAFGVLLVAAVIALALS